MKKAPRILVDSKLFWPLAGLLLAAILAPLALRNNHSVSPSSEPGDLYRRFEHVEGVDASFIKDFPLNDTTTLDVTLLQATTDAGWDTILNSVPYFPITPRTEASLEKGLDVIRIWYSPRGNPFEQIAGDPTGNDACYLSMLKRTLCIFPIENEQQLLEIDKNQINQLKIKNKQK